MGDIFSFLPSLPSMKQGRMMRVFFSAALVLLVSGVLLVMALHSVTVTNERIWAGAGENHTFNFSITNNNGNTINEVRITKPSGFTQVYCQTGVPNGWQCTTNGTANSLTYVEFTTGSIAAGSTTSFNVTAMTDTAAGEEEWTIRTQDGSATNTTKFNSSIDTLAPLVSLMNVSDGTRLLDAAGELDGTLFLGNATGQVNVVFNVTDNESEIATVTLFYNASNQSDADIIRANESDAQIVMANGTMGPHTLWNASFTSNELLNGTRIVFIVRANDTARNGNISNYTSLVADRVYNFTIDSAAPVIATDGTAFNVSGSNTTATVGASASIIVNTSGSDARVINATVSDDGGSGVVRMEILQNSGAWTAMDNTTGVTNGTTGRHSYNISRFNLTDLLHPDFSGDGLYNISVRATDNTSNTNYANFTVYVDEAPPTGAVLGTNLTVDGTLSEGNVTLDVSTNASFSVRLQTTSNVQNSTRNVTVMGNKGLIHNLTFESGDMSGTAIWNITIGNATASDTANITEICDLNANDKTQCNLQFNFSDVLGRTNSTLNLTIYVDALAPNVSILSPLNNSASNYSTSLLVNVTVNETIGPLRNVSFRLRKGIGVLNEGSYSDAQINLSGADDTGLANMTNWIPMSLGTGNNNQPDVSGTWNFTVNLTALNFTDGNYSIEINVTDSAGRQNATAYFSNVMLDSSAPANITLANATTNSFHNSNLTFNVSINVTDTHSGLLNVSIRLENETHTFPWLRPTTEVTALTIGQYFSFTNYNLTHWGEGTDNLTMNTTDGNFTVRFNVTDTAGNQNTTFTLNVTIDTVVPGVTIDSPTTNLNQSGNFTINVTVTESNIGSVSYRWTNATNDAATNTGNRSSWISLSDIGSNKWGVTFTNATDGSLNFSDGNYSIELNVTDKAGNANTTEFVQLVIDNTAPLVYAVASPANHSFQTGDFLINVTVNDTASLGVSLGSPFTTNIFNVSVQLINTSGDRDTGNSNAVLMSIPTTAVNYSNATFAFTAVANGNFDINVSVNDTAGNVNSTIIANVTLDDTAPSVANLTVIPASAGDAGAVGTILLQANITDNLGFGANGIDNNSVVVTLYNTTPLINQSYAMKNATTQTFNVSVDTTTLADGSYTVVVNATDKSGNRNASVSIGLIIQNAASSVRAVNLTFAGGFVTGSDTNDSTPRFLVNTTANATCRYSLDTPVTYYDDMTSTMSNNVSREHFIDFGFRSDRAANGYSLYYACKDVSGNFTAPGGASSVASFSIDSRNHFNVTMGASGDNKVRGDYFATGWNSFELPKTTLLANTGLPTNYNITNVLSSLGDTTLTTANFTTIFAYNGTAWSSYVVGAVTNTFTNFTADTPNSKYYINVTTENERLEIN